MDAIKTIAISATSVRVVLNAERIVYQGRWLPLSVWFDVKGRDRAYIAEFKQLARWYRFQQTGQNGVQVFVNGCAR